MNTAPPAPDATAAAARADYGIDAPPVIRNLLLGAALALVVAVACTFIPGFRAPALRATATLTAAVCVTEAGLMVWSSRVGKLQLRDRLLDGLALRGDEAVLDVGCGRGLLLIGAARRLAAGRAVGIDLWQTQDQSGNAMETTLANARAEGVAERVDVRTGDMRRMPFADGEFDLALSNLAIHNVSGDAGRAEAVREIGRVVKPGGRAMLIDIAGTAGYASELRRLGWTDVQRSGLSFWIFPPVHVVTGRRPG